MYNTNSDIRFKTAMLKSSLCDYGDEYILVKGRNTIISAENVATARKAGEINTNVIFKYCAPFISCKSEINNKEIDNAKNIDIKMQMYNLTEYSNNYLKTSRRLCQYYKDELNDYLADSKSSKSKVKIIRNTPDDGNTKDVEIILPLKF